MFQCYQAVSNYQLHYSSPITTKIFYDSHSHLDFKFFIVLVY
uniref:Uncharacterized protein n=1 Tax=Schistosoma curassoni TaxID=6186 RepID=A0A183KG30_9TREM